ncbi:MAG TPA: 6-pyruvoyl-tetrahydropterin synthase-related protein [Vicinamibacterales bacterium]|jgi:hypothetical protein|nr:6-pyruvoyl-tetrahydropterin synthase-related protein [Vicinamibacterales bacterium]
MSRSFVPAEQGQRTAAPHALTRVCRYAAYTAVVLSIVPLAAPVLLPGSLTGHDAGAHQTYSFLFNRALMQGQLPVRWVEGVAAGLGQPLFNHYQVGFYYLVAFLHWSGPDLASAMKLAIAIAWAGGAVFMFLLCRPLGSLPASLAAAVFLWSPYLLLDVYVRAAYPELTAIALTPGVLWALDDVLRTGRRRFVVLLAVTIALLLTSHLPTALIVAPLAVGMLVGSWIVGRLPVRLFGLAVIGVLLGLGMAAFYVLPAILQMNEVHIAALTTGSFDYHRHFVRPEWWFDRSWGYGGSGAENTDRMSTQLGVVQWIVLGSSLAVLAVPRFRHSLRGSPVTTVGCLLVVLLALFMMTEPAAFVWEAIGPIAFVQYPWRLLMIPTIACGVLAAIVLSCIRPPAIQAIVILCVVVLQWQQTQMYRAMAATQERPEMRIDHPAWPATESARRMAFRERAYDPITVRIKGDPALGRWRATAGAEIWATSATDAHLHLVVTAHEPVKLVITSPFYPGWRTSVDGRHVSPSIDARSGYMAVDVPAGVHRVSANFGRDRLRTIADGITVAALLSLVAVLPFTHRLRRANLPLVRQQVDRRAARLPLPRARCAFQDSTSSSHRSGWIPPKPSAHDVSGGWRYTRLVLWRGMTNETKTVTARRQSEVLADPRPENAVRRR